MSRPALPVITLSHGPWRAEIYDPRADPMSLGARYVHGCYVRSLFHGDRLLTARIFDAWDRFDGEGLPETFETGLGWGPAALNEEYLRIGAGRLRRLHHSPRESQAVVPLVAVLDWAITEQGPALLSMRTEDDLPAGPGSRYGYRLERTVRLDDEGLASTTRLWLKAESWQGHAFTWYAHPFLAQERVDATALSLPAEARVNGPLSQGQDGRWRMPVVHGRSVVSNLWGSKAPLELHLSSALGGGTLTVSLDRPLDHAVVYATDAACSLEPKLAHAMTHLEEASWTVRYRFRP